MQQLVVALQRGPFTSRTAVPDVGVVDACDAVVQVPEEKEVIVGLVKGEGWGRAVRLRRAVENGKPPIRGPEAKVIYVVRPPRQLKVEAGEDLRRVTRSEWARAGALSGQGRAATGGAQPHQSVAV